MNHHSLKKKDDNELLNLALNGVESAFNVLALRHRSMIYQVVYRYIGEPSESEDVCQEVLMKILIKGHLFRRKSSFKSWLYRLTTNASLNYLRTLKRKTTTIQDPAMLELDDNETPEDLLKAKQCQDQIKHCLDSLPEKQKETLTLKFYAQLKLEEIAYTIGVSLSTVKTNVSIASKKFIKCMEQFNERD